MNATPRPWKYVEVKTSCGRAFKIVKPGDEETAHGSIACIYDDNTSLNERPHEEHAANAELIVTAVRGHDALVAACEHAAMSVHHPVCRCAGEYSAMPDKYCTCHVQKARAALDAVRGAR